MSLNCKEMPLGYSLKLAIDECLFPAVIIFDLLFHMELTKNNRLANSITVSEFGLTFLKRLPSELQQLETSCHHKENHLSIHHTPQRRGIGLNFAAFANQTQNILKKETFSLSRIKSEGHLTIESQHKLQLQYKHWLSDQKLLQHKIADQRSRLEQLKYSQYDWREATKNIKDRTRSILGDWNEAQLRLVVRKRDKLGKMMTRKYPKGQE